MIADDYKKLTSDFIGAILTPEAEASLKADPTLVDKLTKLVAGYVHVSFKCSSWQDDKGHFLWNTKNGVFERSTPII